MAEMNKRGLDGAALLTEARAALARNASPAQPGAPAKPAASAQPASKAK